MGKMKLEELQKVDIRKGWTHGQYVFSRWISEENIQELGDTLNLSLTDFETEKFVENYHRQHRWGILWRVGKSETGVPQAADAWAGGDPDWMGESRALIAYQNAGGLKSASQ